MVYGFGCRIDKDSNMITTVDESTRTATTNGYINGVPFESGGGGSSDFSTAEVTITNTEADTQIVFMGVNINNDQVVPDAYINEGTVTLVVVLYKGSQSVSVFSGSITSISGDITSLDDGFVITGDCSIIGSGIR